MNNKTTHVLRSTGQQVQVLNRYTHSRHAYVEAIMPNGGIQPIRSEKIVTIRRKRLA